jgi:iron complex outermembrane receptor protein
MAAGIQRLGLPGSRFEHPATVHGCRGRAYSRDNDSARGWLSSNASQSIYTEVGGYGRANFRLGSRAADSWDTYAWAKNTFGYSHARS